MRGREYRTQLWDQIKTGSLRERGTAATEYTVMMAGMVIMVVASLVYLGGAVSGSLGGVSFAEAVIINPLQKVDCAIDNDSDDDDDEGDHDEEGECDDDDDEGHDDDDGGSGSGGSGGSSEDDESDDDCPWWGWWC
ncbi:MAG: hypothetical protein BMS9Abin07_2114 [Acidimicrobiia bacterium]|nr:MAG: hypothetical protein BMS9Abin07_2114 [Acidimicrobiia bacterium]